MIKGIIYYTEEERKYKRKKCIQPDPPSPTPTPTGDASITHDIKSNQTVGGVDSGSTFIKGTAIEDIITTMLVREIAPTMTVGLIPTAGVKEQGTSFTMTRVNVTITPNSASQLTSIQVLKNGSSLTTVNCTNTKTTYNITVSTNISSNTTVKVIFTYKDSTGVTKSIENTQSYTFNPAIYYGALADESAITDTNILTLTKVISNTKANTETFNTINQLMVYAYPTTFGELTEIKDVNTRYKLTWDKKTLTIGTVNYYVYYSKICKVTNYKIAFS